MLDQFLKPFGLQYEDLRPEERETLMAKVNSLAESELTVEKIKEAIAALRTQAEAELTTHKDTPQTFVSLLTFLIPIIGLIRKWYQDQREVELRARIKVYMSLEIILTAPERQRREINRALNNISDGLG